MLFWSTLICWLRLYSSYKVLSCKLDINFSLNFFLSVPYVLDCCWDLIIILVLFRPVNASIPKKGWMTKVDAYL